MKGTILVVDDDRARCELVEVGLRGAGFDVTWTTDCDDLLPTVDAVAPDAVVADVDMRGMNGLELCERVVARWPDVPVILITAFGRLESAVGAIRAGAYDFLTKPFELDHLVVAVERAVQHRSLREEVRHLRRVVEDARGLGDEIPALTALDFVERRHIFGVLEALGGNKTLAARTLGIDRKTLHRKLTRYARTSPGETWAHGAPRHVR